MAGLHPVHVTQNRFQSCHIHGGAELRLRGQLVTGAPARNTHNARSGFSRVFYGIYPRLYFTPKWKTLFLSVFRYPGPIPARVYVILFSIDSGCGRLWLSSSPSDKKLRCVREALWYFVFVVVVVVFLSRSLCFVLLNECSMSVTRRGNAQCTIIALYLFVSF